MELLFSGEKVLKKYSVAVILKDERQSLIVNDYFKRLSAETHRIYEVSFYDSYCRCNAKSPEKYDMVLIGIREEGDKNEARSFRRDNSRAGLILFSNSPEYALWGYAVEANGYLTYPVEYGCFQRTINRLLNKIY